MEKLVEYIEQNSNKIIGLDGPSGAGKSTIAAFLEKEYDVLVFHTDDYFLPSERKTIERMSEPGGNLDYERMEEEIFQHLTQEYIQSNSFNCQTNVLEINKPVKKKRIILIEGVYSLHPKFQKYYDLKVFLDIDKEEQYNRILKRSGAFMLERFQKEWIPLEDHYFEENKVREIVNLFIKNSYVNKV